MSAEAVLFYIFAFFTLASAATVVFAKSPINSAISLVATFFFLAGLYVLLYAHTIAVLQIMVYAGAIMVLFLFVIMLLNLTEVPNERRKPTLARVGGVVATVVLFGVLAVVLSRVTGEPATLAGSDLARYGTLADLGRLIYTEWLLPFEAISILLLVAMVGAVVVSKAKV